MKTEIEKHNACSEAVEFRNNFKTFDEAWEKCERGDWMLWIAKKIDVDSRKMHLARGKCAELVIHLMKDQRSIDAVKAAIAYGNGEINESELKTAYAASAAAASAAYAASAAAAAYAASAAAAAASAYAAYAAASAAAAAAAASAYAAYAYADTARKEILLKCADICREVLSEEISSKIKKK